ncbi:MAG: mitochondrial fission ELM1 family protein [Pseudomonadota bacterium]
MARPKIWIVTNGRRGDIVQCEAIGHRIGDIIRKIELAPRAPYSWFMPWGPCDPAELDKFKPPLPDLIIASGRRAVPYVRKLARASTIAPRAIFMKYPGYDVSRFAIAWHPVHDRRPGRHVIETLTTPHLMIPERIEDERKSPDPRCVALPSPRLGILLGGNSGKVVYDAATIKAFCEPLRRLDHFASVCVTGSRRTPPELLDTIRKTLTNPHFIWDGNGPNPYSAIVSLSDALLVTGDSHNMVSEALAAGRKTYVFLPPDLPAKFSSTLNALAAENALVLDHNSMQPGTQSPIDATAEIADRAVKMLSL